VEELEGFAGRCEQASRRSPSVRPAPGKPRIVMEELLQSTGLQANRVPYKGEQASAFWAATSMRRRCRRSLPHIDAHKMRYLAMFTSSVFRAFPGAHFKELGWTGSSSPLGVAGPKGMDAARVAQLTAVFRRPCCRQRA
jgi:tripartite-type tricarboxylate transporter receptor subunit TctC